MKKEKDKKKSFKEAFTEWRTENSFTLAQCAKLLDIHEASLPKYFNGRVPEPEIIERIIKLTNGFIKYENFYTKPKK